MSAADVVTLVENQGWDERVLVCRCAPLVQSFIVVTARYVILVDTMLNGPTADRLLEIAEPYRAGRQWLAINTHADWDHAWGNHRLAGIAPLIGTERCAERLRAPETEALLAQKRREEPGRFDEVTLLPPTITFGERLTIDGGDLTLELVATPGHTADHLSIYLPACRTLLVGDAAEQPFPLAEGAASLPALRDSLARLAAYDAAVALYCHAPVSSGPALLRQNIAYFDEVERRCRRARAGGLSLDVPDERLEALVGFPYEEVVGDAIERLPAAYFRGGHQQTLRMMLEWLASETSAG